MLTAAIAAEYNPFHNGHAYQIARTRAAGASHIVAIMSGNYTQRGSAAIAEKHVRAGAALKGGADLVLELPLPYAMGTAQKFALGVATIAEGMGCVDVLSFGSETGYLTLLDAAARAVDSPLVTERQAQHLSTGMTFAKARQLAVSELFGDEVGDLLSTPNDLLAVEYIRQLHAIGSKITPFAVQRIGAVHDATEALGEIASASFIRSLIRSGGIESAAEYLPSGALDVYLQAAEEGLMPFSEQKIDCMMPAVLRRLTLAEIAALPDISEGLEHRIHSAIRQATDLAEVYTLAKSKRYTAARIRRILMAAFLGLDGRLCSCQAPYIRVLGFNKRGREVLSKMRQTARLPVSDSLAYLKKQGELPARFVDAEATATDLYLLGLPTLRPCGYDFTVDCIRGDA